MLLFTLVIFPASVFRMMWRLSEEPRRILRCG